MATSIIKYKGKSLDVNDNFFLLGLCYLKESVKENKLPDWFKDYIKNVISVVIDIKPVGWGYMKLEETLKTNDEKDFFIKKVKECVVSLEKRESNIIDCNEVNQLLDLRGIEKWNKKHYVKLTFVLEFLNDLIILLDDTTPLNHERLMKLKDK